MRLRRQTVEHPFGTIKSWMGSTHFQMKTLKHVGTEMALHVLAYNMKRVMSILGVAGLMEAIRAPAASTPWTWKTDLAISKPIVVTVCMIGSSESWEP
jgi:hypothetical protein